MCPKVMDWVKTPPLRKNSITNPLFFMALLTVADSAFSQFSVTIFMAILNLEGHPNCITGSKVTAILLYGLILPFGGASSGRVCACSLRSRLSFYLFKAQSLRKVIFDSDSFPLSQGQGPFKHLKMHWVNHLVLYRKPGDHPMLTQNL